MAAKAIDDDTIIGIDLGTTNSEVAIVSGGQPSIVEDGGEAILPSCVGLDEAGAVIVGRRARNQAVAAPERTVLSVKRLMGSGTRVPMGRDDYAPQEISAFILKALKERADRALGRDVRKAVITVPAYFTDVQRQATREAGEIAGLTVVRIINEPTAAALSYESGAAGRRTLLVYDLGGGTFDVSVVRMEEGVVEVLASAGDNHLGGDDFDALVLERLNVHLETELGVEHVRDDRRLQARLRRAAERAKIELSDQPRVRVEEDHVATVAGEARHLACELDCAHKFVPLIRRNSKLPATRTEVFFTVYEDQEEVNIKVYQGGRSGRPRERRDRHLPVQRPEPAAGGLRAGTALHLQPRPRRLAAGPRPGAGDRPGDPRRRRERPRALHRRGARRRQGTGLGALGRGGRCGGRGRRGCRRRGQRRPRRRGMPPIPRARSGRFARPWPGPSRRSTPPPAEDREEMAALMDGLRNALEEGRAGQASDLRRELDEILFYLE